MKKPITSAQAMSHPAVVETINALGEMADELRKERDEYQQAADTQAAAHKIERDALMQAAKLALKALDLFKSSVEMYHRNGPDWTHKDGTEVFEVGVLTDHQEDIDDAIEALKKAGVA